MFLRRACGKGNLKKLNIICIIPTCVSFIPSDPADSRAVGNGSKRFICGKKRSDGTTWLRRLLLHTLMMSLCRSLFAVSIL